MEILTQDKVEKDIQTLLINLEVTQWMHKYDRGILNKYKIITKEDLRKIEMRRGVHSSNTSGSTGEPVKVEKTYHDIIWHAATNIREMIWRKWDVTKNIAIIKPGAPSITMDNWGFPKNIYPIQGKAFVSGIKPTLELQKWLDNINPQYIQCYPSVFKQLDTSKLSNFIDWKGTGELGGTMYSSEECGTIAIQCPDNPSVMHVMENIIVETDEDGGIIVTCLTNPYIKRYKHGDHIIMGECNCGRSLQTIKEIKGRVRNMFVMPNGDKKWPLFGSPQYDKFGIKRFKVIQKTINDLELQIIADPLGEKEKDLISVVKQSIDSPVNVTITYVNEFTNYKFEEFVSLVK